MTPRFEESSPKKQKKPQHLTFFEVTVLITSVAVKR